MSHRLPTDPLERAFEGLPRQQASERFTEEVLSALDNRPSRSLPKWPALAWATAATALLALGLVIGTVLHRQRTAREAYRQRVEELRSQHQRLEDELAALRRRSAQPPTVLYLGGDERLDLMVDLGALEGSAVTAGSSSMRQETSSRETRPADFRPESRRRQRR